MLKQWRGAPVAIDRTALFLATILIAAIENCSSSGWREHGEIMWLYVVSMWVTSALHDSCHVEAILHI